MVVASMVVGALAAFALAGQMPGDGRMLLAAHVTGIIGALLVIAIAWTMPMLRYGDVGRARLALVVILAMWANLVIGTAKAYPAVHGVGLTGELANDVVFGLLNAFVVLPTFIGSIAWLWALRPTQA